MRAMEFGQSPFTTDYDGIGDQAATLVELQLQRLSYTLRSKPSWWTKFKDPEIREKWEEEALALDANGIKFSPNEVKYILDELNGFAALREEDTKTQPSCYWRIWESDGLIAEDLRQRLISAVESLENVPDDEKDWHPGSNGQVLDLVHPSLFCAVYGKTLASSLTGNSNDELVALQPPELGVGGNIHKWAISKKFSWIPTDFAISDDGSSAKALSYINNLHPSHEQLYRIIEDIVARFSNLFSRVLTDSMPESGGFHRRITDSYHYADEGREPDQEDNEDDDDYETRYQEWRRARPIEVPTVPDGGYGKVDISTRKKQYSLRGKQAQVIVKLAKIYLTPEKPEYTGGTWHVEGMANEHIVASGIYYYDSNNVTESHLGFRCASTSEELWYEQDDENGTLKIYGLDRSTPGNQYIGEVETKQGRCIAFPNFYQHKVSAFHLADATRPGHRKIVALFLVDPGTKIHSTSHIPPQQAHWAREAMQAGPPGAPFSKLPVEILDLVTKSTGTLMSEVEAKKYRVELMDERRDFVIQHDEAVYSAPFSMCEH